MKKKLYLIIASQDFESANHRNLWLEMAKQSGDNVLVANIHADYVVSFLRKKSYRIKEAKSSPKKITDNLSVFRPLIWIREELLPNSLKWIAQKCFWNSVMRVYPDIMNMEVKLLVYNASWVKILFDSHPNLKIGYYLFDEVRLEARDNSINRKRYKLDEFACKNSDIIYTMTDVLKDSRAIYNKNILTIGNGATIPECSDKPILRFKKSIAFIGVFRDWIDRELLEGLIALRQDILFAFAGPITPEMKSFFDKLLNNYDNTVYYGVVSKSKMTDLYRRFDGVMIPYKNNSFIRATRPIKIVESILAGTPVITVPIDGYNESEFIRFASTIDEFSNQINNILLNPININSNEYISFVHDNTWKSKADVILKTL